MDISYYPVWLLHETSIAYAYNKNQLKSHLQSNHIISPLQSRYDRID